MAKNSVFHALTMHMELDFHFAHEKVVMGHLYSKNVPSHLQITNILTKTLARKAFSVFGFKLGVQCMTLTYLRGLNLLYIHLHNQINLQVTF